MYDKHIDSFIAIAETGSFSAAARQLYISRTALIQQLNLLEKDVGVRLFTRHSKGVTLTPAGRYFLTAAQKIIRISRQTLRRCHAMQESTTVRIGTLPNFEAVILPEICRRFTAAYPEYSIQFVEYPLDEYFRRFQENAFDITTEYLSGYIFDDPDYQNVKLLEDTHCCGVPRNHPLAAKDSITAADLSGQSVVMYAHGITRADDRLRNYLLRHVPDIDIIDVAAYDRSLPLKCELSGLIMIYYSMYWENFDRLRMIPLDTAIDVPIDIGLGYKTGATPAVESFIAVARELYPHE